MYLNWSKWPNAFSKMYSSICLPAIRRMSYGQTIIKTNILNDASTEFEYLISRAFFLLSHWILVVTHSINIGVEFESDVDAKTGQRP